MLCCTVCRGCQIEELRRSLKQVRADNEQHIEELDRLRHEKSVMLSATSSAKRAKAELEARLLPDTPTPRLPPSTPHTPPPPLDTPL